MHDASEPLYSILPSESSRGEFEASREQRNVIDEDFWWLIAETILRGLRLSFDFLTCLNNLS